MENINLNLYKIFLTVAQSKTLIEASKKLYISQPAISKDIQTLEQILNTKLIYRKNNGIELTKEGMEFVKYIEEAFGLINTGEKILKQRHDLTYGNISIGCPSHITALFLMEKMERFMKDFPNIRVKIMSATSSHLVELLQLHKVDFIIDTKPAESIYNNLQTEHLKDFDMIFISNKEIVVNKLSDFNNFNLILPFSYTSTRKKINEVLYKNGIKTDAKIEIDITDLIINAVERGMGVGYVIKESVKKELEDKKVYEIKNSMELPKTSIQLISIKGQLTNADNKFIREYLKK